MAVEPPTAWTFFFSVDEGLQGPDGKEEDFIYKPLDRAVTYPRLLSTSYAFIIHGCPRTDMLLDRSYSWPVPRLKQAINRVEYVSLSQ